MHRASKMYSMDEVLSLFDPLIAEWFSSKYSKLTEPQAYAIPLIHSGENVLVSSPTGSGKTLTAFISVINELFLLAKEGNLEDRVYCVYVSPLKALANDIHRNLEVPLEEIKELAKKKGIKIPKIRVAVRSGDTSQKERQKMLKKPPHIFITTPESLALVLTAPKFKESFKGVKYLIVDEIHELANNKRGVMLSLNLERLQYLTGNFQRIGLSATQAPIEEIAKYLGGYEGDKPRDVHIVEVEARKQLDLKVITPVEDLTLVPYEVANEKMYDVLVDIINRHRTTLIFTNTRSGTEHVAYKLKEKGIENLEAHHGSLSKETRLRVEQALKNGELKAVISSTSLELGIDIGYIDVVVQIGSPKSIAKGLQRIGRSGHAYGATAKGRFLVFDNDELIECTTLVKCAYEGKIDRVRIPKNSLDVLAQVIVGMSIEKRWSVDEAYNLIHSSYCYHELSKEKFIQVLRYLGGKVLGDTVYSKIWFDEEDMVFGRKRSSRMIYFMNMGTIPDEADYLVIDHEGKRLGSLSEKFVEKLQKGDVFVLGARSYEVLSIRTGKVVVKDATGKRPTVPSWVGEMLPRSFDLSIEVGKFREFVEKSIREKGEKETIDILMKEYYLDHKGARSIVSYIKQGMHHIVPTHRRVVIEGYVDSAGKHNIIFHFPFGRRVNDALSRAYGYKITERYGVNVGISITDDAFMLTLKRRIRLEDVKDMLNADEIGDVLRKAIFNTELFKQRFRHCASRSFMVLRRYKGRDISVARQQLRSDKILRLLNEIPDFPVMEETYNEIFNIVMDLPNAIKVLRDIERGDIEVKILPYNDTPSVFAHGIILAGISDIVLMEDRSALLKELHMKLLERVIPKEELATVFDESQVSAYFHNKIKIKERDDILQFLNLAPGADVLHRRGINIYDYSEIPMDELKKTVEEMMWEDKIVSIYTTRLLWTTPQNYPIFATVYGRDTDNILEFEGVKTADEIAKEKKLKLQEILEKLRKMEKAYLVGRKIKEGKTYWYRREREKIERQYALELLIKNLLYFRAPLTFEEIVYSLHLSEEDIRKALKYLVEEGEVVKGVFLVGYGEQYMLRDDYNALLKESGMDEEELQSYRFGKIVRDMDMDEFFDRFLVLFNEDSLKIRNAYSNFRFSLEKEEILYGRFMRGRLCYSNLKNIPLLISVYRRKELDEKERKILNQIGLLGDIATYSKIKEMSNMYPHEVKKIIEKLENNLYVYRKVMPNTDPQNYPFKIMKIEPEGGSEEFFERVVKGYGPLTKKDIENITGLDPSDYLGKFKKLSAGGKVYYYFESNLDLRGKGEYIIPSDDPYVYTRLNEIYDKFGEVFSHTYVKDGKILGIVQIKKYADHLYVDELMGDNRIYEILARDNIVVTSNDPKSINYKRIGSYYVYGEVSDKQFSLDEIIAYLLWKSRVISGRKLKTTLDVAKFLMGLHNSIENIRAYKPISIDKYYRSELLYETLDLNSQSIYATPEHISLYQAIKNMPLDKDMHVVLSILKKYGKMDMRGIMEESPLGSEKTSRALNNLYKASYIAKYTSGYVYIKPRYSEDYAIQKYVENLVNVLGFLSPEIVCELTNGYIGRIQAVEVLDRMKLTKGIFLNDGNIYRIPTEDVEDIRSIEIYDNVIILDPKDMVTNLVYTIKPIEFKGYLVIKEGKFLGVVKATLRRKGVNIQKYTSEEAREIFKAYFS